MSPKLEHVADKLRALMEKHDRAYNPSGVPFKGEKKRVEKAEDPEEPDAVRLSKPANAPADKTALAPDHTVPLTSSCELMVKGSELWVHGLADGIVSARQPLVQMWGEFVTGASAAEKRTIAKFKSKMQPVVLTSVESVAHFSLSTKKQDKFRTAPCCAKEFLTTLEELGFAGFTMECHNLVQSVQQGQRSTAFTLQPSGECFFHPLAFPAKKETVPKRDNVGSKMDFAKWTFPEGKHELGHVKLVPSWQFREEDNTILPAKPSVFLVKPLKVFKGEIFRIG